MSNQNAFLSTMKMMLPGKSKESAPTKVMNVRKVRKFDVKELLLKHEMSIFAGLIAITLTVMGISLFIDSTRTKSQSVRAVDIGQLKPLTLQIIESADKAVSGDEMAFKALNNANAEMTTLISAIVDGRDGAPAAKGELLDAVLGLKTLSDELAKNIHEIESGKKGLVEIKQSINEIDNTNKELSNLLSELGDTLTGEQRVIALKLNANMQQMSRDLVVAHYSESFVSEIANIGIKMEDVYLLSEKLPVNNDNAIRAVEIINKEGDRIQSLIIQSALITKAKKSLQALTSNVVALNNSAEEITGKINSSGISAVTYIAGVFGVISIALLMLMMFRYASISKAKAKDAERVNKENQDAIVRLMNDLAIIADGDLTQKATVTESIVGSIADSVNFTVEELRNLVTMIVKATSQIKTSSRNAELVMTGVAQVTSKQSAEITRATESVDMVVKSIEDINMSAAKAAAVAQQAMEATTKGTQAVEDTNSGMNIIRDHIQDTSKRIKRLGESSQEIGNIISLISSITEQTNVLALNAAIQAVQAGEEGRGFAIVAQEVRQLALRSAEATTKISDLVKLIQTDTNDAVAAMEKSTAGVVEGAKLTNIAGDVLAEIKDVSLNLTDLIKSITVSTQIQTEMAQEMTNEMGGLMKVTEQSINSVNDAKTRVGEVSKFAEGLELSVTRFHV